MIDSRRRDTEKVSQPRTNGENGQSSWYVLATVHVKCNSMWECIQEYFFTKSLVQIEYLGNQQKFQTQGGVNGTLKRETIINLKSDHNKLILLNQNYVLGGNSSSGHCPTVLNLFKAKLKLILQTTNAQSETLKWNPYEFSLSLEKKKSRRFGCSL